MSSLILAAEFVFTYVPLEDEEIVSVSLRASFLEGSEFSLPEDSSQSFIFDGIDRFPQLKWVGQSIIYQIFLERFYNGNPENDVLALRSDEFHYNEQLTQHKLWTEEGPSLINCDDPISHNIVAINTLVEIWLVLSRNSTT